MNILKNSNVQMMGLSQRIKREKKHKIKPHVMVESFPKVLTNNLHTYVAQQTPYTIDTKIHNENYQSLDGEK